MSEALLLQLVDAGRRFLGVAASVEAGSVKPYDSEAIGQARQHLAKIGRALAAMGRRGDELVENAEAQDLRLAIAEVEAGALNGAAIWFWRDDVARVVAVAGDELEVEELNREGREMRERGEIQ